MREKMVGVAGFEPATPASRTELITEKFNEINDLCWHLTTSRYIGGQSVVGEMPSDPKVDDGFPLNWRRGGKRNPIASPTDQQSEA